MMPGVLGGGGCLPSNAPHGELSSQDVHAASGHKKSDASNILPAGDYRMDTSGTNPNPNGASIVIILFTFTHSLPLCILLDVVTKSKELEISRFVPPMLTFSLFQTPSADCMVLIACG